MNLKLLNETNWPQLWESTTKRLASLYGATKLGDQDIFNAVIKENPEIVYQLPCFWNTQLSDKTLSSECYQHNNIKVNVLLFIDEA